MAEPTSNPAHVVIFPFPVQGHMNSMFKLSELLCLAGIHVTYLVTVENHTRLHNTNTASWFHRYPGFRFQMLPENVSQKNVGQLELFVNLYESLKTAKTFLRDLLAGQGQTGPVTCLITDGLMKFTLDIGEETGVPVIYFRTASPCSVWTYFCLDNLIEAGDCPFQEDDDMDTPIRSVPGMEGFLRRRDLPSMFRVGDMSDASFCKMFSEETQQTVRAQGLILNTFEQLDGPIISQLSTKIPNIYTVGPLHAHLKARLELETTSSTTASSNSLREEDRSCIKWLDDQPLKSVIYVSFGSLATVTKHQLMEFWYGLVNSGHKFLWVIRIDSVADKNDQQQFPKELEEGTKARGYTVTWAPQEEVLAHPAIGGFLTHSGWNSTLESIYEGVPMICWPYLADQQINSRYIGEVWKLGLDIKDTCDRSIIEKAVRDLMEVRKQEFAKSAKEMATLAKKAVNQGGDSHNNLNRLIKDIKMMNVATHHA